MKTLVLLSILVALFQTNHVLVAAEPPPNAILLQSGDALGPELTAKSGANGVELGWKSSTRLKDGATVYPRFEIERSLDLLHWEPTGVFAESSSKTTESLRVNLTGTGQHTFYRVAARWFEPGGAVAKSALGSGGAEVFGYGAALAAELERLGEISLDDFTALFPAPSNYAVAGLDPTTARYWIEFNKPPESIPPFTKPQPGQRLYDFRLNEAELAALRQNSFVVSERLGTYSFADAIYRVWQSDLPVFVSIDALLQAWHRSYDMMLEEMEETFLFNAIEQVLNGMAEKVPAAAAVVGNGALRDSIGDADYMIAVARSLLEGRLANSKLDQVARVQTTLNAVAGEQLINCFDLFGHPRAIDFSQFKIRGHYENSERLGRYFKCVMWLGRTDLRVAGGPFQDSDCEPPHKADPREPGTAVVLGWLLNEAGQFETWKQMDRIIQAFVGWTDSMTFAQLGDVLAAAKIRSLADLPDRAAIESLQAAIEDGRHGVQDIRGDYFVSLPGGQIKLPRSFTIFGQKFVPDSWAMANFVFDSILRDGKKIQRRVPSSLDVAFAVLGNNQVIPDLVARIGDLSQARHQFRDGFKYQHNLAAVRRVMDSQPWTTWQSNIYMDWLDTLRTLSKPLTDDMRMPETFRTRAWAMKTLNTQLASWTHLRHDTILYAKQSYTGGTLCSFPEVYVEPVPQFWARLRLMAERTATLLDAVQVNGSIMIQGRAQYGPRTVQVNLADVRASQSAFLRNFAGVVSRLETIALKQLAQQSLSADELAFFNVMIEDRTPPYDPGYRIFNGWYPALFYKPSFVLDNDWFHTNFGSDKADAIVADVHTDLPCPDCDMPDPGSVLHEAVGRVNMLLIVVDRDFDRIMFSGPVLSHHEFELIGAPRRMADSEWLQYTGGYYGTSWTRPQNTRPEWRRASGGWAPPLPSWTSEYLMPMPSP